MKENTSVQEMKLKTEEADDAPDGDAADYDEGLKVVDLVTRIDVAVAEEGNSRVQSLIGMVNLAEPTLSALQSS